MMFSLIDQSRSRLLQEIVYKGPEKCGKSAKQIIKGLTLFKVERKHNIMVLLYRFRCSLRENITCTNIV